MAGDERPDEYDDADEQQALAEAEAAEQQEIVAASAAISDAGGVEAWKAARKLDMLLYDMLRAPMATFDLDGKPHITGEQARARLTAVLGISHYEFALEPAYGGRPNPFYDEDRDVVIGTGTLTVYWPSGRVTKVTEVGGSKPNRYRYAADRPDRHDPKRPNVGAIMDLSDTYKACVTDIFKRCAMAACGVGLWLRKKEGGTPPQRATTQDRPQAVAGQQAVAQARPAAPGDGAARPSEASGGAAPTQDSAPADEAALWADIDYLLEEALRRGDRRWRAPSKKATAVALQAQITGMERSLGVTVAALRQASNGATPARADRTAEEDRQLEAMGWPSERAVSS